MLQSELICQTAFHYNNMIDKAADRIRALDNWFYLGEGSKCNSFLLHKCVSMADPLSSGLDFPQTLLHAWIPASVLVPGCPTTKTRSPRGDQLCNKNPGTGRAGPHPGCWSPRPAQEPGSWILSGIKNEKANCQAAQAALLYPMERNSMNMYGIFSPWNVRGRVCHWSEEVRIHCGLIDLCA